MAHRFLPLLLLLGVFTPNLAHASRFDFIVADQITMKAPLADWGITLAGTDFALLVNKGTAALTADDLGAADFTVEGVPEWPDTTSETINPRLLPGLNPAYFWNAGVPPVAVNEAVGSTTAWNTVLPPLVQPGETLRNTGTQFLYFELRGLGNSPGEVRFDVRLRMGDDEVLFPMFVTLIDDPSYEIVFTHATRYTSVPVGSTAAQNTTWGQLKKLYR